MGAILADDLTGACDVAAALGNDAIVPIEPGRLHHLNEEVIYNTGTREMSPAEARQRVREVLRGLHPPLRYWKIDSLLRGNWAHELAEAWALGVARRFVLAPAFPEQERITLGGIQFARGKLIGSLLGHLRVAGMRDEMFRIEDAAAEADLRAVASRLKPDELPVGSAGLARVIWGPRHLLPERTPGPFLVVFGTASERGRQQVDEARGLENVRLVEPGPREAMVAGVAGAIARELPQLVIVVGGETLAAVAQVLQIGALLVRGEVSPGVALARVRGGPFDGTPMVTKAGEFGDAGTIARVILYSQGRCDAV